MYKGQKKEERDVRNGKATVAATIGVVREMPCAHNAVCVTPRIKNPTNQQKERIYIYMYKYIKKKNGDLARTKNLAFISRAQVHI